MLLRMKGIIALDIDGTTTVDAQSARDEVIAYLEDLANSGWILMFLTGRTFVWGYHAIQKLKCPYYLAVQNGALVLEMPEKKIALKKYLDRSIFPIMEEICADEPSDFAIFSGFENNDRCFYRPQYFSKELLKYLEKRMAAFNEPWHQLPTYDSLTIDVFPSIKCFGDDTSARRIAEKMEKQLKLHAPVIRDPYDLHFFVIQATQDNVTKGSAIKDMFLQGTDKPLVIAAGDDYNDICMFEMADIKIAMERAPQAMRDQAHIIAKPAEDNGIIEALTEAIKIAKRV